MCRLFNIWVYSVYLMLLISGKISLGPEHILFIMTILLKFVEICFMLSVLSFLADILWTPQKNESFMCNTHIHICACVPVRQSLHVQLLVNPWALGISLIKGYKHMCIQQTDVINCVDHCIYISIICIDQIISTVTDFLRNMLCFPKIAAKIPSTIQGIQQCVLATLPIQRWGRLLPLNLAGLGWLQQ